VSRLVSAAKGLGEELHAVADAERRQVFLDHPVRELRRALLVDARRTAGEDDRPGVELLDLFPRAVMRDELAENANLPDAAGDELAVLRSEVEDDGRVDLMVRIGGVFEELDGLVNDIDVDHVAFSRVDRGRGGCVGCAHEYSFTCLERACWRDGMERRSRNSTMVPDDGIPAGKQVSRNTASHWGFRPFAPSARGDYWSPCGSSSSCGRRTYSWSKDQPVIVSISTSRRGCRGSMCLVRWRSTTLRSSKPRFAATVSGAMLRP